MRNDANARRLRQAHAPADMLVAHPPDGIDSRNGRLMRAETLHRYSSTMPDCPWSYGYGFGLSDMAERLGNAPVAQQYLQAALQAAPDDGFCLAAYADLLIRERRYGEVVHLLAGREAQDNLLLRLSIAGQGLGGPDARRWSDLYAARVQAAQRDGDVVHLREQAMFALDVQHDSHAPYRLRREAGATARTRGCACLCARGSRAEPVIGGQVA